MATYFTDNPIFIPSIFHSGPLSSLGTTVEKISEKKFNTLTHAEVTNALTKEELANFLTPSSVLELFLLLGEWKDSTWYCDKMRNWKLTFILSIVADKSGLKLEEKLSPKSIILFNIQKIFGLLIDSNIDHEFQDMPDLKTGSSNSLITEPQVYHVKYSQHLLLPVLASEMELVPDIFRKLLNDLLINIKELPLLVSNDIYLPAPPLYCSQPQNFTENETLTKNLLESQHRQNLASIVNSVFLLLRSSNLNILLARFYINHLVTKLDHLGIANETISYLKDLLVLYSQNSSDYEINESLKECFMLYKYFCFLLWWLHVRDQLSRSLRKMQEAILDYPYDTTENSNYSKMSSKALNWMVYASAFSQFTTITKLYNVAINLTQEASPTPDTANLLLKILHNLSDIEISGNILLARVMEDWRTVKLDGMTSLEEYFSSQKKTFLKDCVNLTEMIGPILTNVPLLEENQEANFPEYFSFEKELDYLKFIKMFVDVCVTKHLEEITLSEFRYPVLKKFSNLYFESKLKNVKLPACELVPFPYLLKKWEFFKLSYKKPILTNESVLFGQNIFEKSDHKKSDHKHMAKQRRMCRTNHLSRLNSEGSKMKRSHSETDVSDKSPFNKSPLLQSGSQHSLISTDNKFFSPGKYRNLTEFLNAKNRSITELLAWLLSWTNSIPTSILSKMSQDNILKTNFSQILLGLILRQYNFQIKKIVDKEINLDSHIPNKDETDDPGNSSFARKKTQIHFLRSLNDSSSSAQNQAPDSNYSSTNYQEAASYEPLKQVEENDKETLQTNVKDDTKRSFDFRKKNQIYFLKSFNASSNENQYEQFLESTTFDDATVFEATKLTKHLDEITDMTEKPRFPIPPQELWALYNDSDSFQDNPDDEGNEPDEQDNNLSQDSVEQRDSETNELSNQRLSRTSDNSNSRQRPKASSKVSFDPERSSAIQRPSGSQTSNYSSVDTIPSNQNMRANNDDALQQILCLLKTCLVKNTNDDDCSTEVDSRSSRYQRDPCDPCPSTDQCSRPMIGRSEIPLTAMETLEDLEDCKPMDDFSKSSISDIEDHISNQIQKTISCEMKKVGEKIGLGLISGAYSGGMSNSGVISRASVQDSECPNQEPNPMKYCIKETPKCTRPCCMPDPCECEPSPQHQCKKKSCKPKVCDCQSAPSSHTQCTKPSCKPNVCPCEAAPSPKHRCSKPAYKPDVCPYEATPNTQHQCAKPNACQFEPSPNTQHQCSNPSSMPNACQFGPGQSPQHQCSKPSSMPQACQFEPPPSASCSNQPPYLFAPPSRMNSVPPACSGQQVREAWPSLSVGEIPVNNQDCYSNPQREYSNPQAFERISNLNWKRPSLEELVRPEETSTIDSNNNVSQLCNMPPMLTIGSLGTPKLCNYQCSPIVLQAVPEQDTCNKRPSCSLIPPDKLTRFEQQQLQDEAIRNLQCTSPKMLKTCIKPWEPRDERSNSKRVDRRQRAEKENYNFPEENICEREENACPRENKFYPEKENPCYEEDRPNYGNWPDRGMNGAGRMSYADFQYAATSVPKQSQHKHSRDCKGKRKQRDSYKENYRPREDRCTQMTPTCQSAAPEPCSSSSTTPHEVCSPRQNPRFESANPVMSIGQLSLKLSINDSKSSQDSDNELKEYPEAQYSQPPQDTDCFNLDPCEEELDEPEEDCDPKPNPTCPNERAAKKTSKVYTFKIKKHSKNCPKVLNATKKSKPIRKRALPSCQNKCDKTRSRQFDHTSNSGISCNQDEMNEEQDCCEDIPPPCPGASSHHLPPDQNTQDFSCFENNDTGHKDMLRDQRKSYTSNNNCLQIMQEKLAAIQNLSNTVEKELGCAKMALKSVETMNNSILNEPCPSFQPTMASSPINRSPRRCTPMTIEPSPCRSKSPCKSPKPRAKSPCPSLHNPSKSPCKSPGAKPSYLEAKNERRADNRQSQRIINNEKRKKDAVELLLDMTSSTPLNRKHTSQAQNYPCRTSTPCAPQSNYAISKGPAWEKEFFKESNKMLSEDCNKANKSFTPNSRVNNECSTKRKLDNFLGTQKQSNKSKSYQLDFSLNPSKKETPPKKKCKPTPEELPDCRRRVLNEETFRNMKKLYGTSRIPGKNVREYFAPTASCGQHNCFAGVKDQKKKSNCNKSKQMDQCSNASSGWVVPDKIKLMLYGKSEDGEPETAVSEMYANEEFCSSSSSTSKC